jgi:hypothetical protein
MLLERIPVTFEHSGMAKEIPAFLRAEIGNDATNPTQEARDRMFDRLTQMRLSFLEASSNGVEVGGRAALP